jgi:hypothetical protein
MRQRDARVYRRPAKVIGGRLFRNPILINTQDVDQSMVTKIANRMAFRREGGVGTGELYSAIGWLEQNDNCHWTLVLPK